MWSVRLSAVVEAHAPTISVVLIASVLRCGFRVRERRSASLPLVSFACKCCCARLREINFLDLAQELLSMPLVETVR